VKKIVVYTHLSAAAKITLELDETKIKFSPVAGGDGVPPGLIIEEDNQTVLYVAAQDFGIAVVEDDRLIGVEASVATSN
jgi:hypothetical protein